MQLPPSPTSSRDNSPPRVPPKEIAQVFVPGEFLYVSNGRDYLQDAYRVISINEWWGPFKKYLITRGVSKNTEFTFTDDSFYRNIMDAIANTPIGGGHSGCSMGFCMRVMEHIALHGEDSYRNRCLTYNGNQGEQV
jgi:hypothetical protein